MDVKQIKLKPVKGLEEWSRKQYTDHYVYYRRKGKYAECHCSECDARYILRTEETGDPFEDSVIDIEKPAREKRTKCRSCGTIASYAPAGHFADRYYWERICVGQKIDDEHFVFRIFISSQSIRADKATHYELNEGKRIYLEKGKKPQRVSAYGWDPNNRSWHNYLETGRWYTDHTGESWAYTVYPKTFKEIKKTGMFKYVPVVDDITVRYRDDCWVMSFYEAAARYPDFEMILKMGMYQYAYNLICHIPVNINPRGKTIENRLRINKERIPYLIEARGEKRDLTLYQYERKIHQHWTDEELEFVKKISGSTYDGKWKVMLNYMSAQKAKNYLSKQGILPDPNDEWTVRHNKVQTRIEYYDYLTMRAEEGYDMTNEIILFPKDIYRRHMEMVLQREKQKQDERKKDVLKRYPKIKKRYKELSDKYSAAAGGYIIRPAKDAAEIVEEGRLLHHCVGGDSYLKSHNSGTTTILFLRTLKEQDIPYITVEIRGNEIVQWYGAYDKKPNRSLISRWLKTYTTELKKREPKKVRITA